MKKSGGKLNTELEKALADELTEVRRRHDEDQYSEPVLDDEGKQIKPSKVIAKKGDFVYDVMARMRVYDRALKLEMVKLKADDPEWGKEFK